MGYLISAHALKSEPDLAKLESLPRGVSWAVYRDDDAQSWYVDTFATGSKHDWPFTSVSAFRFLPRDLPQNLNQLSRVYEALNEARLADGFDRTFLNLNLQLSNSLQLPVLSFYSDDEGHDFACLSQNGTLQRLRCECYDIELIYRNGKTEIQPLRIKDDDFVPTDLAELHNPEAGISVLERNKDHSSLLHLIAGEEVSSFLGTSKPPLGLGSFDGNAKPPTMFATSASPSTKAQHVQDTRPWWKFW